MTDFPGLVEQAVRDLIDRGGIQPVVTAAVNGAARAEVKPGEDVELEVRAETPPGTGGIVAVSWDWDGSGAGHVLRDRAGHLARVRIVVG